jgi:hypothetical protein
MGVFKVIMARMKTSGNPDLRPPSNSRSPLQAGELVTTQVKVEHWKVKEYLSTKSERKACASGATKRGSEGRIHLHGPQMSRLCWSNS